MSDVFTDEEQTHLSIMRNEILESVRGIVRAELSQRDDHKKSQRALKSLERWNSFREFLLYGMFWGIIYMVIDCLRK